VNSKPASHKISFKSRRNVSQQQSKQMDIFEVSNEAIKETKWEHHFKSVDKAPITYLFLVDFHRALSTKFVTKLGTKDKVKFQNNNLDSS
jgi:hypothetical protein